jgi:hypothetical protein
MMTHLTAMPGGYHLLRASPVGGLSLPAFTVFLRIPISRLAGANRFSFPFVNHKLHISCAKLHIAESLSNI